MKAGARTVSKHRLIVIGAVFGLMVLGGCTSTPTPTGLPSLGHWDILQHIYYSDLPKSNLKGNIGPAYWAYVVTLAGFQTDSFGLTVGPDDDVRYTTDGGQSWTKAASALHCRFGLEIVDEKVAWHCGNGGTRFSTDGGQTWQTVAPSACPYMSFLDAQTGWAASPYVLQATSDGGASWNTVTLPSIMQEIVTIALRTASDGYILDKAGNLLVTADGGKSWEKRSLGLEKGDRLITATAGPKVAMRFLDAQHGVVVFDLDDRTVWFAVTWDGGQSWQRAEIPQLRGQSYYYHLFLSQDGRLLTVTDDFNDTNSSIVLRYH
jgi:photosystem II stability/assembly factor-like uncharacterized protein